MITRGWCRGQSINPIMSDVIPLCWHQQELTFTEHFLANVTNKCWVHMCICIVHLCVYVCVYIYMYVWFNPHNNPMKKVLLLFQFYIWEYEVICPRSHSYKWWTQDLLCDSRNLLYYFINPKLIHVENIFINRAPWPGKSWPLMILVDGRR